MERKPLIVVSIIAVILLVLGSLSNVVGYQTVQSSNQSVIKERINQKELLFQTIVDIANNKEIQRISLKSQMSRGIFLTSEFPIVTKNQLKQMYFIGLILSKIISKSRMQSMVQQYQVINQGIQNEINAVIEKDVILDKEITQLSNSKCDCRNTSNVASWSFPVICLILLGMFFSSLYMMVLFFVILPWFDQFGLIPLTLSVWIAIVIGCDWTEGLGPKYNSS